MASSTAFADEPQQAHTQSHVEVLCVLGVTLSQLLMQQVEKIDSVEIIVEAV
jgi:hypothetical protein